MTPEVSGIYSNTFADGTFGIALSGSYQERNLGYNEAGVPSGWRTFRGDENNWGTIPQPGQPGSERIVNRPGPEDIYSVPQNLLYAVNGIQRQRTNGQLTLQYAPSKEWTATLDYTYSENKIQTKRNELSAWFNFGPSSSSWTDGPVSGPNYYSEIVANSDIAMGGGLFASKNTNDSLGFNLAWKPSKAFSLELDAHHSTAESGADSPYGNSAVIGTASFNRGTTTVDFTRDFPVLSIEGSQIDPSLMQVTGSSFRNSYMKSEIDQAQFRGKYKFEEGSQLDFGVSLTDAKNRSAYGFVQRDTWGGVPGVGAAQTPDGFWHADTIRHYFPAVGGSNDPALFNQFFTWDFGTVRDFIAQASGDESLYRAPTTFSVDRRVQEKSQSAYAQYTTDWEWVVPMQLAAGLRYEQTDVTSRALVPTATGVIWTGNNEYSVVFGAPSFTKLKGKYSYVLPSIDFDADLTSQLKLRASYGESIGRPGWNYIQGGQTLDQLARFGGGTGSQGNPGLKPLLSHNFDLSLEYYYAKGSYVAASYFNKFIENYVGVGSIQATPFNLHTPANGVYFQEAVSSGGCGSGDLTCIRNYIFEHYNGTNGVNGTYDAGTGTWSGTIAGQPNDPIMPFTITVPTNGRSSRLQGVELNWQHMFGRSGFGVSANYTYVDSGLKYKNNVIGDQFALVGLSDTANLVVFYENDKFDARLAYNWRSEFLTATVDGGGNQNPVYTEPYAQLDLSMGYKWNDRLSFQFEAINLTDSIVRLHERTKNEIVGVYQSGPRYMIGARYKF
jgi:TonB-dependent receptor